MTVAQLIEELQRMPQYLPAKVLLREVYGVRNEDGEFVDDAVMNLDVCDAVEADDVRHEGSYVLIWSK